MIAHGSQDVMISLIRSTEVAQKIVNELRAAGVRVALDDFGMGYSTLAQLTSFKFDKIKIDRSFVQRLGGDLESLVVVRAILGLAKELRPHQCR
jgi:EAL domain-containing protein (putative c-di-GMP-specific phosphodiesterase class I)